MGTYGTNALFITSICKKTDYSGVLIFPGQRPHPDNVIQSLSLSKHDSFTCCTILCTPQLQAQCPGIFLDCERHFKLFSLNLLQTLSLPINKGLSFVHVKGQRSTL